jgi:hypothetical protein
MSKLKKEFLKKVLDGVWSPFFRKRIVTELNSHIEDLMLEQKLTEKEALEMLGDSLQMNFMYKNLFYKKLKNDFIIFGTITSFLFILMIFYISNQVDTYIEHSKYEYIQIQTDYMRDINKLHIFKRSQENKNAGPYLRSVLSQVDREISKDVLRKLEEFNYWDLYDFLPKSKIQHHQAVASIGLNDFNRLLRASYKNIAQSKNKDQAKRLHQHLAQLIYSTETMQGFRIAQNMMSDSVYTKEGRLNYQGATLANRVSGMTWSLMNLQPTLVNLVRDLDDKNLYQTGFCHHAQEIWYKDYRYQNFLKTNWPLEKARVDELMALRELKQKLKKDCRLSFIEYIKEPKPMDPSDITLAGNLLQPALGQGLNDLVPEIIVLLVSDLPYFRPIAGRYVIWRTSHKDYSAFEYYRK